MRDTLLFAIVGVLMLSGGATAQGERRVSIQTVRHETIDGLFVTATANDVVVRVAGQPVRVPFNAIATMSFDERRGRDEDDRRPRSFGEGREHDRLESPSPRPIAIGAIVYGRLDVGDVTMPSKIDWSTVNAFNDIWELDLPMPATIEVSMTSMQSDVFKPHLALVDLRGRKVEGDMGVTGRSTIRRSLSGGHYQIWAGASTKDEAGTYSLLVTQR